MLVASSSAFTLTDTFEDGLDPVIWAPGFDDEGSGVITATNDEVQFTAEPAASLIGTNNFASYRTNLDVLANSQDWTATITANLASLVAFGTFDPMEAAIAGLGVRSSIDSDDYVDLLFVAGDPFGSGPMKVFRGSSVIDGVDASEDFSTLSFGDIGSSDLILNYNHSTEEITASISIPGVGSENIGTYDVSTWDYDVNREIEIYIEGSLIKINSTISSGTIAAAPGDITFDNLVLTGAVIPEPSHFVLLLTGLVPLFRRRR
ncbi:MAG: hypothetical protein AAGC74_11185 [Verrucomicrobiota bacterium]